MIARMWTKKETQKTLTGLRRAGYTVAKDGGGFYKAREPVTGEQVFAAMPGTRGYLVRYVSELFADA